MALDDSIWWTRKARIQTEKRLLSNAFQSQLILLWYSFFGVFVSVYYLKFNTTSEYAGVAWVIFSVLILVVSGFISGQGFKERAGLIKECYEILNGIYQKSKKQTPTKNLEDKYEQVLSVCENHTDRDFHVAMCLEYLSHPDPTAKIGGLTKKPTCYIWLMFVLYWSRSAFFLGLMYVLPLAIFLALECL
jgi:hypothetical protein